MVKGGIKVRGMTNQGWRREEDPDCEPDNMPRLAAGEAMEVKLV